MGLPSNSIPSATVETSMVEPPAGAMVVEVITASIARREENEN
jgi:hypothetical protein